MLTIRCTPGPRPPPQLFYLALSIFVLALVGVFYPYNRGSLYTALIVLYALTACIAGYVASSYYRQMEGELWVRNILLTCFVFCGPFLAMFSFLNTVAIVYRVSGPGGGRTRQLLPRGLRGRGLGCVTSRAAGSRSGPRAELARWSNALCLVCVLPQSTAALPFGTIVIMLLIWSLVTIPLTVFGGIAGKNNKCVPRGARVAPTHTAWRACVAGRCPLR
jgi:hypothetical protein